MDVLQTIVQAKHAEIKQIQLKKIFSNPMPRGFFQHITAAIAARKPAIIAEIKKASPSAGIIKENMNVAEIAIEYELNGATCLSVLTDSQFFQGSLENMKIARATTQLPVLRKDFIIDQIQIEQSWQLGADCILLIAAILTDAQIKLFTTTALDFGLDVLLEVHTSAELNRVEPILGSRVLLGINNRNLTTFTTNITTTTTLMATINANHPAKRFIVTESGIRSATDVEFFINNNVYGFLIGESLMRSPSPGGELRKLFLGKL